MGCPRLGSWPRPVGPGLASCMPVFLRQSKLLGVLGFWGPTHSLGEASQFHREVDFSIWEKKETGWMIPKATWSANKRGELTSERSSGAPNATFSLWQDPVSLLPVARQPLVKKRKLFAAPGPLTLKAWGSQGMRTQVDHKVAPNTTSSHHFSLLNPKFSE